MQTKHRSTKKGMEDWMEKWKKDHPVLLVGDKDNQKSITISYHEDRYHALDWVRNNPGVKWDYKDVRIVNKNRSIFYI